MSKLLEMKEICKGFPGVKALQGINLELSKGEILALLGENGAGKSTLLKVLSGVYMPDSGEIFIEGEKQNFKKPADAAAKGIGIIYQELNFYNELTVAENIFAGKLPKKGKISIDIEYMNRTAANAFDRLGVKLNPTRLMKELSTAEKQLVEIARALVSETKILVMDEPTSALNDVEVHSLLKLMKDLSKEGLGIIYISHKLDELYAVADRVQVMRDGRNIGTLPMKQADRDELIRMMVGRQIEDMYPKEAVPIGDIVMEVANISNKKLKDISFNVRAGEILGVFGLMGAGRTEMCKTIFGASRMDKGEIKKFGKTIRIRSVSDAKKHKIAYLPNDRKAEGLILTQPIKDNLASSMIDEFSKLGGIITDHRRVKTNAEKWSGRLKISAPDINTTVGTLSGGNQQKVVMGKWLETEPDVIILNEPTRGIDVASKAEIYKLIETLCKGGMAVIMVSSEQTEILSLTDRTIVMCEGRITGELRREEYTPERLMKYALGRSCSDETKD